jgi:excinuclease ABC subunit C
MTTTQLEQLKTRLRTFPNTPGIYCLKGARGEVLYVGKANRLRTRLRSYFRKEARKRYQVGSLLKRVTDIEVVLTDTEKEALILERTLIRTHRPRYNIFFRDDKTYVSVKVSLEHDFPGIFRTRTVRKDGARYFGPYTSGLACRETIDTVTRFFRLRTCSDREFANRSRPCIQYQIGRCTAPCVGLVSPAHYAAQIQQALLLLGGKENELTRQLETDMQRASDAEQFEEAGRIRDLLGDIAKTVEPQKMIRYKEVDRDYVGWAEEDGRGAIAVLTVREGKVIGQQGATVILGGGEPCALLESFCLQFYQTPRLPPPEISIPVDPGELTELEAWLGEQRGARVRLRYPQRGTEAKLLRLAHLNAQALCRVEQSAAEAWTTLCQAIGKALHLERSPDAIECVDISNWDGKEAVGSIVAFAQGGPTTNRYRHYRIRGPQDPNDYRMMHEVLTRRIARAVQQPLPDLLLVDGGKGQLGMALRVLEEQGETALACAAIAKPREGEESDKIFLPGRKNPLPLRKGDPVLLFLQRVRDEAHRFAITYQRSLRLKDR